MHTEDFPTDVFYFTWNNCFNLTSRSISVKDCAKATFVVYSLHREVTSLQVVWCMGWGNKIVPEKSNRFFICCYLSSVCSGIYSFSRSPVAPDFYLNHRKSYWMDSPRITFVVQKWTTCTLHDPSDSNVTDIHSSVPGNAISSRSQDFQIT